MNQNWLFVKFIASSIALNGLAKCTGLNICRMKIYMFMCMFFLYVYPIIEYMYTYLNKKYIMNAMVFTQQL